MAGRERAGAGGSGRRTERGGLGCAEVGSVRAVTDRVSEYLVHGLVLRSDRPLGIPTVDVVTAVEANAAGDDNRTSPATGTADVVVDLTGGGELEPADAAAVDGAADDVWVFERWLRPGQLLVTFPHVGAFSVTRDEITLLDAWDEDPAMLAHLVLDHLMPRVVGLRGDLALHASGVVGSDGDAWLFVGETGTGKSTLATALAAAGCPLLDDDGVRIVEVAGRPYAVPGYAGVRLLPDSGAAALPGVAAGPPMAEGHDKRRYAVDAASGMTMAGSPVPVHLVFVLRRASGAPGAVVERRPLGFAAAITELARHAFHTTVHEEDLVRDAFERVSHLASAVRVEELHLPDGLDRLPDVVGHLLGDHLRS